MGNAKDLTGKSGALGAGGLPKTTGPLKLDLGVNSNPKKAKAETFKLTNSIKAHGGGNAPTSRRPKV